MSQEDRRVRLEQCPLSDNAVVIVYGDGTKRTNKLATKKEARSKVGRLFLAGSVDTLEAKGLMMQIRDSSSVPDLPPTIVPIGLGLSGEELEILRMSGVECIPAP
jgi:hypothetical protein